MGYQTHVTTAACKPFNAEPFPPQTSAFEVLEGDLSRAWQDLCLKAYLSDEVALGREPTADEDAIFSAASKAADAALEAIIACRADTWQGLAQKFSALAHPLVESDAGFCRKALSSLQADIARLAPPRGEQLVNDAQFIAWEHGRDAELRLVGSGPEQGACGRHEAGAAFQNRLLSEPCASPTQAAAKLRALFHAEVGVPALGMSETDELALGHVLSFLEGQPAPEGRQGDFHTRAEEAPPEASDGRFLDAMLHQALTLDIEADAVGSSSDGEIWLGEHKQKQCGELLRKIHAAPCSSPEDAAAKTEALWLDVSRNTSLSDEWKARCELSLCEVLRFLRRAVRLGLVRPSIDPPSPRA
ncbi:MAG: hypothetical protein ACYDD1_19860, partial [Caulobacteraceae bacterium]